MTSGAILSLGIALALFSASLAFGAACHGLALLVRRWRSDAARRAKWRGLVK